MGPAVILGMLAFFPGVLMDAEHHYRPLSLAGAGFLGGCFTEEAWGYLRWLAQTLFDRSKRKEKA